MRRWTSPHYLLLVVITPLLLHGCQHPPPPKPFAAQAQEPAYCREIEKGTDLRDRIETLNRLSKAFHYQCYETVIYYGTIAQAEYRFKTYSLVKETSSIFLPDGTFIDYVMESYERGFLTFLLAASYHQLQKHDASKVELRRLDHEIITKLYNYGEDPVNILLLAVMWEKHGETGESRVDWNRLQGQKELNEPIRSFAFKRMERIDAGEDLDLKWKIYGIGQFPDIEWDFKFTSSENGYFSVRAKKPFIEDCASETGLRISTASWFNKIAMRHDNGYHPLLNAQSWLRLPAGIVYSITTFASGAGIAIGGCALGGYANDISICEVSLRGGAAIIRKSPDVLRFTLKPDLRRWENVPESFLITTADDLSQEKCSLDLPAPPANPPIKFLD
jgi:hypothetical protein